MGERKRTPRQAAGDVADTTSFDRVVELGTDLIAAVPVFGPVAVAFLRQVVPRDHAIYLGEVLREAFGRIEDLEEAQRHFTSEDGSSDFEQVMEALADRRNRDKREFFVAALANAAAPDRLNDATRKRMLDTLVDLRPSHLRLLAVIATSGPDELPDPSLARESMDEYMKLRLAPGGSREHMLLDWRDLERAGIVGDYPSGLATTPSHQRVANALTAYGKAFARFIEAEHVEPDG
jgi:hypothetical protein